MLTMHHMLSDIFLKLVFTLFGVYVWELFMTLDFEWSLVTRRRNFRWPLVRILDQGTDNFLQKPFSEYAPRFLNASLAEPCYQRFSSFVDTVCFLRLWDCKSSIFISNRNNIDPFDFFRIISFSITEEVPFFERCVSVSLTQYFVR